VASDDKQQAVFNAAGLVLTDDQIKAFQELAREDDWHRHFVGSEIRLIIGDLIRARSELVALAASA
jgi:hypothetical protein